MSESRIQELLSESREYLLETAVSGETPLHLAVSWAGGLRLLLQALDKDKLQTVLEAEDCRGHTALDYALLLEQVDSIRLLIDAGAFIDLENTQNIQTGLPRSLLPFRPGSKGNLMRLLCRILTERRERLAAIAFRWLPSDSLASFNLTAQQMPQEQAFDIVAALKPHAFSEHWPYEARPGSVYHTRCMSTDRAKALYEAGFDRTDVSFHGFTPLMTVDFYHIDVLGGFSEVLDLTNWFVGHGADIDKIIPSDSYPFSFLQKPRSSNFRVVHRCAYWLGDCWPHYHDFMELQKEVPSESIALLMQISERSERDACECFCTGHGCSPLSLLTRGLLKDWEGEPNLFSYGQRYQELFLLTDLLSRGQVASQDVVRDVLRIIAFTELGMSHTCCVHDIDLPPDYNVGQAILDGEFSPIHLIDPDEAREIQEEDRYTAAWLDKFMVEVGEKLAESDQPYKEFFTGYFRTRLRKVLRKKEHLSPEDMRNIRDIGVVLDSESESDSDLWSGSDSDSEMQMN